MSVVSLTRFRLCTKCGITYPRTAVYFDRKADCVHGLVPVCKGCRKAKAKNRYWTQPEVNRKLSRQWREQNPERARESIRRWAEKNSVRKQETDRLWKEKNKERVREHYKAWVKNNAAQVKAVRSKWIEFNIEIVRQYGRRWADNNPEKKRECQYKYAQQPEVKLTQRIHRQTRRAQKASSIGQHTSEDIQRMYMDQDGLCAYCEVELFGIFHIDHMMPLSKGGGNGWDNIAITCPSCNLKKNAKTVEEWMSHGQKGIPYGEPK